MSEVVYVLLNASHPGLCKIGFCSRSPHDRARELSASTGVPTPFVVAWWEEVSDGPIAEREIHKELESVRENRRREFFRLDIKAAISLVQRICAKYRDDGYLYVDECEFDEWQNHLRISESRRVIQVANTFVSPHSWETAKRLVEEARRFRYLPDQILSLFHPDERIRVRFRSASREKTGHSRNGN